MNFKYLSVCSGIEAATVAWQTLGWEPVAFAETEKFPSAVLQYHYPMVPNLGDFTQIRGDEFDAQSVDVMVGGTPCQSFSQAGLRKGLDDDRGNLAIDYGRLLCRVRPKWFVWENVPGVLTLDKGRAFARIMGFFSGTELPVPKKGWGNSGIIQGYGNAYGLAWRVLDSQYFGVPQRRRRLFVVGHIGGYWQYPTAVLLERESLQRDVSEISDSKSENSRVFEEFNMQEGQLSVFSGVAPCLTAHLNRQNIETPLVAVASVRPNLSPSNISGTLTTKGGILGAGCDPILEYCLKEASWRLRVYTPVERERLMGLPDGYTDVPIKGKPASPSARCKAIGNSFVVPVIRWIGNRINQVEAIKTSEHNEPLLEV
jgi:DNA (cytosine-5)-methyltransferase 1